MSSVPSHATPLPNYRTTRLLGIFNIVFATCLLIFGLCMTVSVMVQPMFFKAINDAQKTLEEKGEATRKAELDSIAKREADAKSEEEKKEFAAQREEIEARPKAKLPGMMDMSKIMNQPMLQGWTWVEILTGLSLNIALFISGIGLLKYNGWSRTLGIWVALLKLARLVLVYGFFIISVVPPMSKTIGEAVGEMMAAQQGIQVKGAGAVPDAQVFTKIYTITYSLMGAGMISVGSIYPALMLWFLTRPRVKAACEPTRKPISGRDEL